MVEGYDGYTWVAFLDVSGFKREVGDDIALATGILDKFYQRMYDVCLKINRNNERMLLPIMNVVAASDCAVIFSRPPKRVRKHVPTNDNNSEKTKSLSSILNFVQRVNCLLIDAEPRSSVLTTCTFAYGFFVYQDKRELSDMRKNCFLGAPYMEAYMDNERLKSQPGYSRIMAKDPNLRLADLPETEPFSLLGEHTDYWYFYWMLDSLNDLDDFEKEYQGACLLGDHLKYIRIKEVLSKYTEDRRKRLSSF
jgi:hypothetical protein